MTTGLSFDVHHADRNSPFVQVEGGECAVQRTRRPIYAVTGASNHAAACNGLYFADGIRNDKPSYRNDHGAIMVSEASAWKLHADSGLDCASFLRASTRKWPPVGSWHAVGALDEQCHVARHRTRCCHCCRACLVACGVLFAALCCALFVVDRIAMHNSPSCAGRFNNAKNGYGDVGSCALSNGSGTGHKWETFNRLYPQCVAGVVFPCSTEEVESYVASASRLGTNITVAGTKHSGGGQTSRAGSLVLDMSKFANVTEMEASLDLENRTIIVDSGITWRQIEGLINPHRLSLIARQSAPDFSVGGSLTANAHGSNWDTGTAVSDSVVWFDIVGPDAVTRRINRGDAMYSYVFNGWGLFGVITKIKLQLIINDSVNKTCYFEDLSAHEMQKLWIEKAAQVGSERTAGGLALLNAHYFSASWHPLRSSAFMGRAAICEGHLEESLDEVTRPVLPIENKLAVSPLEGRMIRWWRAFPRFFGPASWFGLAFSLPPASGKIVSRTLFVRDSYASSLDDCSTHGADALDEYFIPLENMSAFLTSMKTTLSGVSTLANIAMRPDRPSGSFLRRCRSSGGPGYEPTCVAIVLYQRVNFKDRESYTKTVLELSGAAVAVNGTWNLAYTRRPVELLRQAFPDIEAFFEQVKAYDPEGRFRTSWWESGTLL